MAAYDEWQIMTYFFLKYISALHISYFSNLKLPQQFKDCQASNLKLKTPRTVM